MEVMSKGLCKLIPQLYNENLFDAVLALGGTGGTSLVTPCMRLLPLVEVIDVDAHINDSSFAIYAAEKLITLIEEDKRKH